METIDEETAKLNCDIMMDIPETINCKLGDKTKKVINSTYRRMYRQETIMKRLMEQEVISLLQSFEEIKLQEEEIGKEKLNEAVMKLNDDIAASRKAEASIREEASGKIQKLRAEKNLEVQRIINRKARTICHLFALTCHNLTFHLSFKQEETIASIKNEAEKEAGGWRLRRDSRLRRNSLRHS